MPAHLLVVLLGSALGLAALAALAASRGASSRAKERLIPIPIPPDQRRTVAAPKRMAMLEPGLTIGTIGAPWARIRPLSDFWK
ncbi:MAG: hypothetical protein ABI333_26935 [bacterium]